MTLRSQFITRLGTFCLAFGLGLISRTSEAASCESTPEDPSAGCVGQEACNDLIAACAECGDTDFECDEEDEDGACVLGSCG
jgi:hypothetical protein